MSAKGHYFLVMSGHLLAELDLEGYLNWKFQEEAEDGQRGEVHPIKNGDFLRVFDEDNCILWSGVIAFNDEMLREPDFPGSEHLVQKINGRKVRNVQGSARPKHWLEWFEKKNAARLEVRVTVINTHYDEPNPQLVEGGEGVDRAAERERLIKELIELHDKGDTTSLVR